MSSFVHTVTSEELTISLSQQVRKKRQLHHTLLVYASDSLPLLIILHETIMVYIVQLTFFDMQIKTATENEQCLRVQHIYPSSGKRKP